MIIQIGNIFNYAHKFHHICITTNSVINKKGELVMGAGIAKAAKLKDPTLPLAFANAIKNKVNDQRNNVILPDYYLIGTGKFLAFQTKRDWKDNSPLELVATSISYLERLALKYPNREFGLPFPGCNNGGLKKEQVLPYLQSLPNNVTVFQSV